MTVAELIARLSKLDPELQVSVIDPFADPIENYVLDDLDPIIVREGWVILQLGERA